MTKKSLNFSFIASSSSSFGFYFALSDNSPIAAFLPIFGLGDLNWSLIGSLQSSSE